MLKERVDGLLVSPVNERRVRERKLVNQLRVEGTPIVLVDRYFKFNCRLLSYTIFTVQRDRR